VKSFTVGELEVVNQLSGDTITGVSQPALRRHTHRGKSTSCLTYSCDCVSWEMVNLPLWLCLLRAGWLTPVIVSPESWLTYPCVNQLSGDTLTGVSQPALRRHNHRGKSTSSQETQSQGYVKQLSGDTITGVSQPALRRNNHRSKSTSFVSPESWLTYPCDCVSWELLNLLLWLCLLRDG
jgi:hypothetical protein